MDSILFIKALYEIFCPFLSLSLILGGMAVVATAVGIGVLIVCELRQNSN